MNVSTEAELNAAITAINGGGGDTAIVVTATIVLSANLVPIAASLSLAGSGGAIINALSYRVLEITQGAEVTLSIAAKGSAPNFIRHGTLIGAGGALGSLVLGENGTLSIPAGQTLATGGILVEELGKLDLKGTLDNSGPIVVRTVEFLSTCQVRDMVIARPGAVAVQQNETLTASSLVLQGGLATVLGTLATSQPVVVLAGSTLAGNQGTIGNVLIAGGELSNSANNGFAADQVTNVGGTLSQGFGGTVSVTGYTQIAGTLEVVLAQDPAALSTGVLASIGPVALQGGTIRVKVLSGTQNFAPGLTFDIVTAAAGIVQGSIAFETVGFPAGYSGSLSSQPGKLVLTIQKTG